MERAGCLDRRARCRRRRLRGGAPAPDRPQGAPRRRHPRGPCRTDLAADRRRSPGRRAGRPPRPLAVRARRAAEGRRDPVRRGPAVRLDRGGDRPAEGGASGRHGPRPQPRSADRALPPGRPHGRLHRAVLARRAAQQAGDPRRRRAWTPRPSSGARGPASTTRARARRTSCATRPAATRGASWTSIACGSARSTPQPTRAIGRARYAGPRRERPASPSPRPPDRGPAAGAAVATPPLRAGV